MEHEGKSNTGPVTTLIAREIRPDRMKDFEEWVKGIYQVVMGFEGFLGADLIHPRDHPPSVAPAKYKTAILTILALYPPLLALSTLLSYVLPGWPRALLVLLNVLLLVPTMTYYIMPWVTRQFRSWLYP